MRLTRPMPDPIKTAFDAELAAASLVSQAAEDGTRCAARREADSADRDAGRQ